MSWVEDGPPPPCTHPVRSQRIDGDGLQSCDYCGAREDDPQPLDECSHSHVATDAYPPIGESYHCDDCGLELGHMMYADEYAQRQDSLEGGPR